MVQHVKIEKLKYTLKRDIHIWVFVNKLYVYYIIYVYKLSMSVIILSFAEFFRRKYIHGFI